MNGLFYLIMVIISQLYNVFKYQIIILYTLILCEFSQLYLNKSEKILNEKDSKLLG
jgi:hypothetical protein